MLQGEGLRGEGLRYNVILMARKNWTNERWAAYMREYRTRRRVTGGVRKPRPGVSAVVSPDICTYCGNAAGALDHVQAQSRGGTNVAGNLVPTCGSCNASKGAKSLGEWVEVLMVDVERGRLAERRIAYLERLRSRALVVTQSFETKD